MPELISLDYRFALEFLDPVDFRRWEPHTEKVHGMLHNKTGAGHEFTGWVDWPLRYPQTEEYERVKTTAERIIADSDVLVVIGIGGSYLGAQAALQMLTHTFYNQLPRGKRGTPKVLFMGNQLSSVYHRDLFDLLEGQEIAVNVISKSGTTTEPAIAFRLMRKYLEERYGKEKARERIFVTTDRRRGALKQIAEEEGYQTFVVPDDLGGRYSVLSAVGLLPMAVAGIDVDQVMQGAQDAYYLCSRTELSENPAYQYAVLRNIFYRKGKTIELLVTYEPGLMYLAEWWKQLFGESEGKEHKGIFPASVQCTTDLHSLGQYIQDGERSLFETVIYVQESPQTIVIHREQRDLDELNFLAGKTLEYVNRRAMEGAMLAHTDGGVPNLLINVPKLTPYYFGQLVYFFQKACGMSGYLLGVNPFDQPGVEEYKRNMFALLGKPGFEELGEFLNRRLNLVAARTLIKASGPSSLIFKRAFLRSGKKLKKITASK